MEPLQQFHTIIASLLKTNNVEREAAEKQYNEVPVNQRALLLYQLGIDKSVGQEVGFHHVPSHLTPVFQIRDMAFVLLRRLIADKFDDLVALIPNEFNALKDQLIQAITNEETASLRKRMTDVLSDIARQTIDEEGVQKWETVIEFIGHCGGGNNAGLREIAMILIEYVFRVLKLYNSVL